MSKYRVGIIGCGGISRMHAGWYRNEERTDIVAAADIRLESVEKFGEELGVEAQYTDYVEMLQKEQLDIVSVCTRPKQHAEVTIGTAKGGVRGILTEKPMGENLGQAKAMVQACEENGVRLAIDHQLRFDGTYVTAKQLIADGAIGQLHRIHGLCDSGDLKDNATHTVDLMRFINSDRPIDWVFGQIERIGQPMYYGLDSENGSFGYFRFEDNVRGIIESGRVSAPGYHHIYCYGTDGEIELTVPGGPGIRLRNRETAGEWITPERLPGGNPVQDLIACIEEDRPHRSSGHQGYATLEVLMAMYQSSRQRRRVDIPMEEMESPLTLMIQEGLV